MAAGGNGNGANHNGLDSPRRRRRWLRRRRRYRHQSARRSRRLGAAHGSRPDAQHRRTSRSTCGRTTCRIAAPGRRARPTRAGRPASPTAPRTAARSSRASRTPSRRAATSRGSARAFSAAAPTTTAESRCGSPTTTSSHDSRDGLGFDWPISYEDLAPYYDKAERFIGVIGTVENIRSAPDGIFDTPAPLRAHDMLVQRSCAKLDIRAVPARQAVTTSPRNGRPGCHYCGQCGRGCMTASNYAVELRADLPGDQDRPRAGPRQRHGARAHHRRDRQGHRGLVHRQDRRHREASPLPHGRPGGERVRIVAAAPQLEVVATSAGPRQLLRHGRPIPDGHRRLEHVGVGARALGDAALQLRRLRRRISTCRGGAGTIIRSSDFPRGYHIEVGGGYGMPGIGSFTGIVNRTEGYGVKMKQAIRDEYGTTIGFVGPRRDDPQRAVLLRDRSRREGSLGHSRCCASTGPGAITS